MGAPFSTTARWPALGTTAELAVTRPELLDDAVARAQRLLNRIDQALSRFRADSDLTRANAAAGAWAPVDRLLVDAVSAAVRAARATGGLVDPTLGRPMAAIGYDRDLDDVRADRVDPASVRLAPGPPCPGAWTRIGVDPGGRIRVPEGTALDLGATGKGFAADLIAADLVEAIGCGVVISLGGDVAVAGDPPATCDGTGWPVAVGDAGAGRLQTVLLDSGGLATSSTRRRLWRHGGLLVHHLLDPATGMPVPPIWDEVSVRARSCVDANAASTAAMVLGDSATSWLDSCGLPGRLVGHHGRVLLTAGWPVPEDVAAAG
ncbi:MAG TPA: FAD:protein FMN transferase [Kineosporiaceae bacterium]|nr:FAD:protein FMN transferase [Kineosporiaceae bacterium]